ncbi:MAG: beta-lactamase family protein, partial [Chloroflexi bacterium]|nr:beta-lactamase family protein [Chloroflexota bacterium]
MLPTASPESVGMSSDRLQRAFGMLQRWLNDGVASAVASVVARRGKIVGEFYSGRIAPQADAKPVTATTLFHTASIGKPMTATAVMLLVEAGRISLNDAVGSIVSDCNPEWAERVTVRHLLTHTSGLPQDPGGEIMDGVPEGAGTPTMLKHFPQSKLAVPIGSKVEYSNVGFGLLGLIIEAASGQSYPAFMRDCVFAPAGMSDSYLAPPEHLHARIAYVEGVPNAGSEFERFNSKWAR